MIIRVIFFLVILFGIQFQFTKREDNMHKELIETTLKYISFKYAYYNLFILLFSLFQNKLIPFWLPIGILIVQELFFWKYYSQNQIIPQLQHTLHILAGIYVLLMYYLDQNYYVFVNVFIFVSSIIAMKSNYDEQIQHEYTNIFKYVKGFYGFAILIASICVTIKLNELVFWTWSQTFWWYWMYLSAIIGSAFTILMILISKLINQYYYTRQILHPSEYKSLAWIFYVLVMSSVISGAWIINTFNSLGIDLNLHIEEYITLIVIGTHFIIFCFGTYKLIDDITYFFAFLLNQEITQRELPNSPRQEDVKKKQVVQQTILLKQISTAFFRRANTRGIENFTTNNEIFTERANQSQNIVIDIDKKQRIKKSKQKTDIDIEHKQSFTNQICIICCEKQANAVLMKCGHGGVCFECAFENISKNKECFLCRQQVIEIYEIEKEEGGNFLKVISKTKI